MTGSLASGLRWQGHGRDLPVTLIAPGLGATPGEARIPASGLSGTRVVVAFPSHGDAADAPAGYWTYPTIGADLERVADEVGATRAVGVSMGAGGLTELLTRRPDRFDRVALLLPAALDKPRATPAMWAFEQLADAVEAGDVNGLRELVAAEVPAGIAVGEHVSSRVDALMRLGDALRTLPEQVPVNDASALQAVRAEVLVIGAVGDPLHPEQVARDVAAALPYGRLELVDSPAPLLTHRREIRSLLVEFLAG
ncbi:alpha/beta hydrolase [Kutzneria sp. NPDC051319]|uniref:alpha/beta fold hydrolase n=1 Tax=Kutzneria sp. NPDC051319 TaxID=3155047 RepID=UPI0034316A40